MLSKGNDTLLLSDSRHLKNNRERDERMKEKWWKNSVVYQIYPKSFQDSNGDGIGDLRGIIQRLSYLKELGIDVIWLSPVYASPMKDGGYDISDYQAIDPMFGDIKDMDELIEKADKMGIKILMDLVVNHTSSEHRWFKEAISNPDSKYRKYYIFKKGEGGHPPNNWRSYFGGSAWEPVPGEKDVYYLHAFAKEQPDLNWENQEVREEIISMIKWWLDKGLGGFRIDAILNLKKKMVYGALEPDGEDGMVFIGDWILNQPGILEWLKEVDDRTFRRYNSFTVAEAGVPDEQLADYIGEDGCFRTVFNFSYTDIDVPDTGEWYKKVDWTVPEMREAIFNSELQTQNVGWGAVYLENHDQPRSINKYIPAEDISNKSKKMLATLYMMLRGTPFIYQGQEIGMENIRMNSLDDYEDIASHDQYNRAVLSGISAEQAFEGLFRRSRDNSRTPMQWSGEKNAGFSNGESTWLKVNPNYETINVELEEKEPESVLNYYKKLTALRKSARYGNIVVNGLFVPIENTADSVIAYKRVLGDQLILTAVNMSSREESVQIEQCSKILLTNAEDAIKMEEERIVLPPYGAVVLTNI